MSCSRLDERLYSLEQQMLHDPNEGELDESMSQPEGPYDAPSTRSEEDIVSLQGRASRSEYWWWALFTGVVLTVLALLSLVIGVQTSPDGGDTPGAPAVPLLVLLVLFYLAILVPSIAVAVRRLHDAGYSGWLVLLALIPSLGGLILLVFTVLPSSPAGAKYGPPNAYPPASYPPAQYPPNPYPPNQYPPA